MQGFTRVKNGAEVVGGMGIHRWIYNLLKPPFSFLTSSFIIFLCHLSFLSLSSYSCFQIIIVKILIVQLVVTSFSPSSLCPIFCLFFRFVFLTFYVNLYLNTNREKKCIKKKWFLKRCIFNFFPPFIGYFVLFFIPMTISRTHFLT